MLSDLINTLVDLGVQKSQVKFLQPPGDPTRCFISQNGRLQEIVLPRPERADTLVGLRDLIAYLADAELCPQPEVWVRETQVHIVPDRSTLRGYSRLHLLRTDRFETIRALTAPHPMTPRDVVKMMRFELTGAVPSDVVAAMRRIDFTRRSEGRSSTEHGKESLGRSVELAVQQADNVPQSFPVTIPVWSNPGLDDLSVTVEIGIYLDMEAERIVLRVLPDQLALQLDRLSYAIADRIRDAAADGLPVFVGTHDPSTV